MIVTLCEVIVVRNPSGEGGDVELGARTSEKFSVFAFGLLALISCIIFLLQLLALYSLLLIHCFIYLLHIFFATLYLLFIFIVIFTCCIFILSIIYSYNEIALRTSNSYLEESGGRSSEPFTGYSASSLVLG